MKPYLLALFCLISMAARAQIIMPDTVCQYESVNVSTPNQASTYIWIDSNFTVDQNITTGRIALPQTYTNDFAGRMKNDNGHWYHIGPHAYGSGNLGRYDLGSNPNSAGTFTFMAVYYTTIHFSDLEIVKNTDNGNWYGFAIASKFMLRLNFGTSLGNIPTTDSIPLPDIVNPTQISVEKYGSQWVGFISCDSSVFRLDFGTSVTNIPSYTALPEVPGADHVTKFAIYCEGRDYYMLAGTAGSKLYRYYFGNNIQTNSPGRTALGQFSNYIMSVVITYDCNKVISYIIGNNTAKMVMDFGSSITNSPAITTTYNFDFIDPGLCTYTYNNKQYWAYFDNANIERVRLPLLQYPTTATVTKYYDSTTTLTFNTAGLHTITLLCNQENSMGGAPFCKDVYVKASPIGTLTSLRDTGVCPGVPIPLDASGYNGAGYLWSTGATTPAITTTGAGNYWVKVSGAPGCANGTDTIKIKSYPGAYANLGADTSACADSLATLKNVGFSGAGNYLWNTGETTTSIQAPPNNTYWLQVTTLDGCVKADTINVTVTPSPVVALTDTALCPEGTMTLHANAQPAGSTYLWSTGNTTDNTTVTAGNDYWLEVTNARKCVSRDTVTIDTRPLPNADLGSNFAICADSTTTLQAPDSSNYTYLWNTGSLTPNAEATPGADYWVLVTDQYGCVNSDTVTIGTYALPVVNLGDDAGLCPEGKVLASPLMGNGYTYNWSTGATTESIKVYADNTYSLAVTDKHGCTGNDDISYTAVPLPELYLGAKDTTICNDRTLILPIYANNGDAYLWNDGSTEQTLSAYQQGVYTLAYSNQCYTIKDTITIHHRNCSLWFPGAFTPNGDGKNDIARVLGDLAYVSQYHLSIYNRWGRLVYSTEDLNSGWDGSYKGTQQDIGTYNYIIQYTYKGYPQKLDGVITLVR